MMQSAEHGLYHDVPRVYRLHNTRYRAVVIQSHVRTRFVIIHEVCQENTPKMLLIEYDHIIKAFPTHGSAKPFDIWILPR